MPSRETLLYMTGPEMPPLAQRSLWLGTGLAGPLQHKQDPGGTGEAVSLHPGPSSQGTTLVPLQNASANQGPEASILPQVLGRPRNLSGRV